MARSKLPYVAGLVLAGVSSSGLGTGCLFVTDFDPIGEGGSSTGTLTTSSTSDGGGTASETSSSASMGGGGAMPCVLPLTVEPFATFTFAGENDAIEGMLTTDDGSAFVVGHAAVGSQVSFATAEATANLDGSFILKLDPVNGILQAPLPDAISSLRIDASGITVSVLAVEADVVSLLPFYAETLAPAVGRSCTLSEGSFTGGAVSFGAGWSAIAVTYDDPDATLSCKEQAVDLPPGSQFAVVYFNFQDLFGVGNNLGVEPTNPMLAIRDGSSFDICFGNKTCLNYDGSPDSPTFPQPTTAITRSVVGSIRGGGGTLEGGAPIELTQFAPGEVRLDILADAGATPAPAGGVLGISSNDVAVIVSGFESGPTGNHATFLRLGIPPKDAPWTVGTYDDPKMSETESWAVAGTPDASGANLTGALMYRCAGEPSPLRAAIFTAPFD